MKSTHNYKKNRILSSFVSPKSHGHKQISKDCNFIDPANISNL